MSKVTTIFIFSKISTYLENNCLFILQAIRINSEQRSRVFCFVLFFFFFPPLRRRNPSFLCLFPRCSFALITPLITRCLFILSAVRRSANGNTQVGESRRDSRFIVSRSRERVSRSRNLLTSAD